VADDRTLDLSMFLASYLDDAREGFQEINDALLVLEKDPCRTQVVDGIFRAIHTLKSSSAMLKFTDIAGLAHSCEDLLDLMRKGKAPITTESLNLLFEVTDTLQAMVGQRTPGASEEVQVDSRSILESLRSLIGRTRAATPGPGNEVESGAGSGAREAAPADAPPAGEAQSVRTIEKVKTLRVHVEILDRLFDMTGELIITKNRIDNLMPEGVGKELKRALAALDRMIREMQETTSAARLVPVDETFQQFPRMVRDLAREKDKEVELVLEGREIELDKSMLDAIGDPLIHLVRNAIDHGIESADSRVQLGKPRGGLIRLAARRSENHIIIEVEDDGRGVDLARVGELAARGGPMPPKQAGSPLEKEMLSLIFRPGFSTASEVTGLSGRGVGLDVVKVATEKLGGTVDVVTRPGQGTLFTLTLPLATAIMQTLLVGVGDQVFMIPSDIIRETLEIRPGVLRQVKDRQVLILRGKVIPFIWLDEMMNLAEPRDRTGFLAVIISRGDGLIGVGVETVFDQMENIIKPLDPIARAVKGFSGGAILGNGRVALLVELASLLNHASLRREGTES
jgi:two-component system, chemotaxis family, sensor kinase CheA